MDNVRRILELSFYNLKKWIVNPRIYILFILISCYTHYILSPIAVFAKNVDIDVSPFVFPFFISSTYTGKLLLMGVVLLFCDAPFTEQDHPYIILRSGRRIWYLGQLIYILIGSAIYSLALILITVIVLLPNISLTLEWGKVITTLAQTNISYQYGIPVLFNKSIVLEFTPFMAMTIQFLLCWLTCVMLGNLLFFVNARISRAAGSIVTIALILLQVATELIGTAKASYFSPTAWISFSKLNVDGVSEYPTITYAISSLIILILILSVLSYLAVRRKDVEVLKSI